MDAVTASLPVVHASGAELGDPRTTCLRLAHLCLNDQIDDLFASMTLRAVLPGRDEHQQWQDFEEVLEAVALVDSVQLGLTHWCEVVPDASGVDRDEQALDSARTRLDLALDEIVGGG